jgi:hypothetical protein
MKYFTDRYALTNFIGRLLQEVSADSQVKALNDFLVDTLEFTPSNASVFTTILLRNRQPKSAEYIGANASKLVGNWLGMSQYGAVGGYLDTTSYKWWFRPDLTFEYRTEGNRGYSSPFGSNFSSNSSDGFDGVWAPNDAPGDELEVITIVAGGSLNRLSVAWLDKAIPERPRSCRIDQRDFARQ